MGKVRFISSLVTAFIMSFFMANTVLAASGFEVTEAVVGETSENVHASVYGVEGMTVRHKAIFHQLDDYADLVLTIKNTSPNIRKITDITDNNANVFVSYSYDKHVGEELNPGDSFAFVVRITNILDDVQDPSDLTQTNSVAFNIAFDETPAPNASTEQANDDAETDLVVPNTGVNTEGSGNAKDSRAVFLAVAIFASISLAVAAILLIKKKPRTAIVAFIASLSVAALIVPLSANADDDVETLNLASTIGIRKKLHIKMDASIDGVSVTTGIDLDIPYAGILQMQQESGFAITPAFLVDEALLYDMPSQYAVDRIEYSNGYDDEAVDPDAPLTDDLYVMAYIVSNLHRYSITYELNGGTMPVSNPDSYTEMSHVVIDNPTKEDYYFTGWTIPGVEETPQLGVNFYGRDIIAAGFSDLHFVANWREARIFNITYDLNGGTLASPNPDTYKEGTQGFTLNNPTKTDWVFTGWAVEATEDSPVKDYTVRDLTDDITLVANWKQVHLKFTKDSYFTPVSGEIPEDIVLTEAIEIVAPDAYYKNADDNSWMVRFDAWYTGNAWSNCEHLGPNINCSGVHYYPGDIIKAAGTLPDNDITVYAGYQLWDHAITYVLGEGGHFEGDYPQTYNWYSEFDFPAPVREGYIFTGWKIEHLVSPGLAHYHAHWTPQLIGINKGPITMIAQWEEGGDLTTIEYLQDVKYGNCANTPVGVAVTLKDRRDEKSYRVKRLKDGKCWMVDNLALEDYTLTSVDSDIAEDTTFTLPAGDPKYFTPYYSVYSQVNILIDPEFGGYYSYNAAVAGTGYTVGARDGEDAEHSICPKGWNLPSGPVDKNGKADYEQLFNLYNDVEAFTESAEGPNMTFSGQYYHSGLLGGAVTGSYWTATTDYQKEAYTFEFSNYDNTFRMNYSSDERERGSMVRCHMWD